MLTQKTTALSADKTPRGFRRAKRILDRIQLDIRDGARALRLSPTPSVSRRQIGGAY